MTFYYRGAKERPAPVRSDLAIRVATALVLIAYPAGCIALLLAPDTSPEPGFVIGELIWAVLLLTTLGAFAFIAPSYQQRIVGEETDRLDEFEMQTRQRAYAFSYKAFTALSLIGLIYLASSLDIAEGAGLDLWRPTSFEHWSAIIWGALLYAFVLPTAYIGWTMKAPKNLDA